MVKIADFGIILFSITVVVFGNQNGPKIEIEQGVLRGKYQQTRQSRTFNAFSGIPYAQPPVGNLRFKAALPAKPWKGVLDASQPAPICPQMGIFFNDYTPRGSEDCLYLNVFTPQLPEVNTNLLPVMFYIHGGAWVVGSGNTDLLGADFFLDKDVVLVTTNYRLGALGFLSTGDEVLPGNNGLKDQNLALKWVKNNIVHFGGDPEKITIFGQSAGGASAHYHMLSPLSKDFFQRAIAHSGVAISPFSLASKSQAEWNAKKLANCFSCPTSSSREMIECLMKIDALDIIKQDTKFMEWGIDPLIPFKIVIEPNVEGAFITENPMDILKSGKAADVPFITGFTTEDGAFRSSAFYSDDDVIRDLNKHFSTIMPKVLQYEDLALDNESISKKIRQYYFGNRSIDNSTKMELTNMITDAYFFVPHNTAVEFHTQYYKQPVYYYLFGYRGSFSLVSLLGNTSYDYGVSHGDEMQYLFRKGLFSSHKLTESDEKMIEIMTTLWSNFAKTGNPTPEMVPLLPTKWEPVQSEDLEYYFIKSPADIRMLKSLNLERAKFWRDLSENFQITRIRDEF